MATEKLRTVSGGVDVNRNYAQLTLAHFEFDIDQSKHCINNGTGLFDEDLSTENNSICPTRLHQPVHPCVQPSVIDGRDSSRSLSDTSNDDILTVANTTSDVDEEFNHSSDVQLKADSLMESSAVSNNNGNHRDEFSNLAASHYSTDLGDGFQFSEGQILGESNVVLDENKIVNDGSNCNDGSLKEQMPQIEQSTDDCLRSETIQDCTGTDENFGKQCKSSTMDSTGHAKPFSSIPGPWPSLPLIGTGWQYFYLGNNE